MRDPEGRRTDISYMPQRFGLYEDLTVDENIRFYADLFGVRRGARRRSRQLLDAAGMERFTTGWRATLRRDEAEARPDLRADPSPRVLLLDEPTNGVDPVSRRDFWRILYSLLGEGVTILMSTAYLDEAERCHRVALLHQGRLLLCDTPAS